MNTLTVDDSTLLRTLVKEPVTIVNRLRARELRGIVQECLFKAERQYSIWDNVSVRDTLSSVAGRLVEMLDVTDTRKEEYRELVSRISVK